MYQPIGIINAGKVPGLESILYYMNENLFSKDDPAMNEHHYHIQKNSITKKHITYTMMIQPKHIILKTTYIPMNIITIKNNM